MFGIPVPIISSTEEDITVNAEDFDHFVPQFSLSTNNDFMLISEDITLGPKQQPMLSQSLKVSFFYLSISEWILLSFDFQMRAQIFDALSNNSEIDHPLCEECTDSLLEMLDKQLKDAEAEWNDYNHYLKRLEQTDEVPNLSKLEKELGDLKGEEERLIEELAALKKESDALKTAIKQQEEETERLQTEEQKYWREYTKQRRDLMLADDEKKSLDCQVMYAQYHLEKLKKTNIFQTTFHIWQSGQFGTINGFRLGRLPAAQVEFNEINAAWGQTALLLASLAKKIGLKFHRYNLVPYGNHSYIEVLSDKEAEKGKQLPLYGSGAFRFLWDTKFDAAMVAFLDCLQQFQAKVEEGNSGFHLPYKMDKGKIEDSGSSYSVK